MVPVQRLNIFHQTFRSDGQASNYPWTVKITNAKAPVHFQATGATTFSSTGMTDKQEAFIQISDADMYRMIVPRLPLHQRVGAYGSGQGCRQWSADSGE